MVGNIWLEEAGNQHQISTVVKVVVDVVDAGVTVWIGIDVVMMMMTFGGSLTDLVLVGTLDLASVDVILVVYFS